VGNGHVFCTDYISEDEARDQLIAGLDGEMLAEPRLIRFRTGRRAQPWRGNVVAIGLAAGFIEPLESTAIYLVQNGIQRLLALFPDAGSGDLERDQYNTGMAALFDDIRDFIILHYKATERDDTPFWRHMRDMAVPETLAQRMAMFKARGRVFRENAELFSKPSWVAVMFGQHQMPAAHEPLADSLDEDKVAAAMARLRQDLAVAVAGMPTHEDYLRRTGAWATQDAPMVTA
jgi:tryptophan halogenase